MSEENILFETTQKIYFSTTFEAYISQGVSPHRGVRGGPN